MMGSWGYQWTYGRTHCEIIIQHIDRAHHSSRHEPQQCCRGAEDAQHDTYNHIIASIGVVQPVIGHLVIVANGIRP
jgi:hypothetical protein